MATPGELQLVSQELQVALGDGQLARVGSIVRMRIPPGPLIVQGHVAQWRLSKIITTAPFVVYVSGGPVNQGLNSDVHSALTLDLVTF
jgi:hypothetical protein